VVYPIINDLIYHFGVLKIYKTYAFISTNAKFNIFYSYIKSAASPAASFERRAL